MKKKRYQVGNSFYEIPENEVSSFLKDNPKAFEVKFYDVKGSQYNIPIEESDAFEIDMGLKKKEPSQVALPTGGKAGTSEALSGFGDLKPAKIQPIKVEVPKQLREEEVKIPKQVAGAKVTDEGQSYVSNLVSSLDRGFYKNLIGNPVKGLGTLVEMGTSAMTGGKVKEGPVSDALMRFGNWFNNAIDEVAPQDPEFKNSLSDQFGQALGQVGSLVLTGGVGAGGRGAAIAEQVIPKTATTVAGKIAAKAAPTLRGVKELTKELATPASISAGLTVGQSEFERAKEAGATDEQAFEAFYKNAAVGSVLEKIPVMQFLKRFNNATSGGVVNYLKTKGVAGITGGLEEATTEVLQQIYANKTAQDIYNVNQNIFEGLTESGGIGFGVGFLLNAMGAQAKILRQQGKEQEAQTLENQEQEFKARAEGAPPPAAPPPPPATPAVEDISEVAPQVPAPVEEVKAEVVGEEVAPKLETEELEKEYRGKTIDELVSLKKELYPTPDIETPMTPEEKLLDRIIADKFSDINKDIAAKRKAAEESPRFTSYEDAQKWIEGKSKEYKNKNEFLASQEYKDALPDINALYKVEKADYAKKAKDAMDESGVKIGDRVIYDYVTPFGAETYSGTIVDRDGVPFVKFDEGQKTMSGKQSVRWHKGFIKEEVAPQVPVTPKKEIPEEYEGYYKEGLPTYNIEDFKKNPKILESDEAYLTIGYPNSFIGLSTDRSLISKENNIPPESIKVGDIVSVSGKKYAVEDISELKKGKESVRLLRVNEKGDFIRQRDLPKKEAAELSAEEIEEEAPEAIEELPFGETTERKERKKREITDVKRRALNLEIVNDPRGEVLQYFLSGGRVNPSAVEELFGRKKQGYRWDAKKSEEEIKSRRYLTDKGAPSIEELAEKIAGVDRFEDMQDFRNAIEEVILDHTKRETMAEELVRDYDADYQQQKMLAELEGISKEVEEETRFIVSQIPEAQQEEILRVLDKFRDNQGFINWRAIASEYESGFEPVLLELSEPSQKIIEDAIKQIQETGRVSSISAKPLQPEAKAGDAARRLAERIRQGKISKLGGFRAGTGFDAVWDASLEVIAKALEGGASVADAIEQGLKYAKSTGWYKKLTNPSDFDKKYREQLNEEYNAIQEPTAGEIPVQPEAGVSEEVETGVPPTEPPKATQEGEGKGEQEKMTGISNEQALNMRFDMGLPVFDKPQPESWNELNERANEEIRNGYNIEKLLEKLERGVPPTSLEEVILAKYAATLAETFEQTRSEDVLGEYERVTNITNSIGTLTARALNVRKLLVPKEDTLADFFVLEKEETGVDELTDEQRAVITKEYEEIKATTEALQKKVEELQGEVAKKRAGEVVTEERKKVKKARKTDQEFTSERKQIVEDIREKLRKARQESKVTIVPYANELIAISPDVAKLVKSLVEQGVVKLEDVVNEVYATLKPEINDLTKKDVTDLIAGEYNKKKPTRGDIAAKIQDLRTEIKLINQLEALEAGEIPKNPQRKIQRNRELKQLRDKIKEHPTMKLADAKKRMSEQIAKLEKDLSEGNYDQKPERREIPLDEEGKKLQKKLIELKKQREIRRIKNEYDKRTKGQKALDKVLEIANVPRSLMASTDFSAPLNQALIATISYPDLSAKAVQQMIKATASQDAFDQWFYELKDDPRYDLMKELKLRISDPNSAFLTAKEEAFMGGYAEQIPGVGVLVKASERAYVQYLNKLRVDLFNRFVDRFEEQGKTYANNPRLYKATAKYINNITGSGSLPKIKSLDFEQFAPVFNAALFSPRLMASRIQMLNPFYFGMLPKELKIQYAKDMGSTLALGSIILTLFALYGKTQGDDEEKITVETDPTSSDFARIKQGDVRWDIWGGMQPYIRLAAQIGYGERKSTKTGLKQSLDGEGAFGTTRGDALATFIRGKLSPIPAIAVDLAQGRNAAGEKVTLEKELFSHLLPLSAQSIAEAIKAEGPSKIVSAGLPAIFGIGLQVYGDRPKEVKTEIKYKGRDIKLDQEQIDYFQDKYNELSKKGLETLKKSAEYKAVDRETQVEAEAQLQRLMMKKSEEMLTKKYRNEFLRVPVTKENPQEKKVKERLKQMIKRGF